MKKLEIWVLLLAGLTLLGGCGKEQEPPGLAQRDAYNVQGPLQGSPQGDTPPRLRYQRSVGEAKEIAAAFFPGSSTTRGGDDFSVDVVLSSRYQLRGEDSTGAGMVDTMLYVLNLPDSGGYFLVAGDTRVGEVLAANIEGHLDLESLEAEHPMRDFLGRLPGFIFGRVIDFDNIGGGTGFCHYCNRAGCPGGCASDPRPRKLVKSWYDSDGDLVEYVTTEYKRLLKPLVRVEWHQRLPYNCEAPLINGDRALAGCVPIALAQLMYRHQFPDRIGNKTIQWDVITDKKPFGDIYIPIVNPCRDDYLLPDRHPDDGGNIHKTQKDIIDGHIGGTDFRVRRREIGTLLRTIGDEIGVKWGVNGTSGYSEDALKFLKKIGYSLDTDLVKYDSLAVMKSLEKGNPVYIRGDPTDGNRPGHAWLIDGYEIREHICSLVRISDGWSKRSIRSVKAYLHFNWGWGKSSNGYFLGRVYDTNWRDKNKAKTKLYPSCRFAESARICPNIHPNK